MSLQEVDDFMEILHGGYRIRLVKASSKLEMERVLLTCKHGFIKSCEPENYNSYYVLLYHWLCDVDQFGVGIYSESQCYYPTFVSSDYHADIVILIDNRVLVLDLCNKQMKFEQKTDSPIFFAKYYNNTIVVISELSMTQLKRSGDVLITHYFDDIITSYKFAADMFHFSTMSCSSESIQLN